MLLALTNPNEVLNCGDSITYQHANLINNMQTMDEWLLLAHIVIMFYVN